MDLDNNQPQNQENCAASVVTYQSPWPIYPVAWSNQTNQQNSLYRVAIGSFIQDLNNKIAIIQYNESKNSLEKVCEINHNYPATKILFNPSSTQVGSANSDLLATSGEMLRLFTIEQQASPNQQYVLKKKAEFSTKISEYCAPLTSLDWNVVDPSLVGTASIDTTCTIWDINKQVPKTQLIAHDKEVFDIAFNVEKKDYFASVGADGSVRLFDLRSLEHSTIIYETPGQLPLLRVEWNKKDSKYLATFEMDSKKIIILDIRVPTVPVAELMGHNAPINHITWSPSSAHHLVSVGDDAQALIWDYSAIMQNYSNMSNSNNSNSNSFNIGGGYINSNINNVIATNNSILEPSLQYSAETEINSVAWSKLHPDRIAITADDKLQMLSL